MERSRSTSRATHPLKGSSKSSTVPDKDKGPKDKDKSPKDHSTPSYVSPSAVPQPKAAPNKGYTYLSSTAEVCYFPSYYLFLGFKMFVMQVFTSKIIEEFILIDSGGSTITSACTVNDLVDGTLSSSLLHFIHISF